MMVSTRIIPRNGPLWLTCVLLSVASAACDTGTVVQQEPPLTVQIIAPVQVAAGGTMPVVVRVLRPDGALDTHLSDTLALRIQAETTEAGYDLRVLKGIGSLTVPVPASERLMLSVERATDERAVQVVQTPDRVEYAGALSVADHVWGAGPDHVVREDLTLPAGATLTLRPGVRVLIGAGVNVRFEGEVYAEGTEAAPILIGAADVDPWGGIEVVGTLARFAHTFITQGGADASRAFGHSESQPVILANEADLAFEAAYIIDNVGKGPSGRRSRITYDQSLISRTDTGGEFVLSVVHLRRSHILDIPDPDEILSDDDNDGLYFHPFDEPSIIDGSFIVNTEDDAVDHFGGSVIVRNSWLEGCEHEGIAASRYGWVEVYNTVIKGNGQGVEAGFGTPTVRVDHSVIVENGVGVRFGDSYDWGSEGEMHIRNTILYGNDDNVWNFDLRAQAAIDSVIHFQYSMTNDAEYDTCATCWAGTPRFDRDYLLRPDSDGTGQADDGNDLGLVRTP